MGFFYLSGQETVNAGPFSDMPILVLAHDMTIDRSDGLSQSLIDESEANENAILRFSTGSRRVIAKHSGHFVHIDPPDVVEREVVGYRRHRPFGKFVLAARDWRISSI